MLPYWFQLAKSSIILLLCRHKLSHEITAAADCPRCRRTQNSSIVVALSLHLNPMWRNELLSSFVENGRFSIQERWYCLVGRSSTVDIGRSYISYLEVNIFVVWCTISVDAIFKSPCWRSLFPVLFVVIFF